MTAGIILERMLPAQAELMPKGADAPRIQRVYIFPTRHGFVFALMLLVMLLGAINYNNSMAFVLTFFLGGLALVCILHTYRNLCGLVLRGPAPGPVFAGETAVFPLILDNRVGYQRYAVSLHRGQQKTFPGTGHQGSDDEQFTDIVARHQQTVPVPVITTQRGVMPLGRVKISSCFPLGLFRAWSWLETGQACIVYPKPGGKLPLPPTSVGNFEDQKGGQNGTDDFIGFRKYRPGDSTRNIAWKALAREQGPLVKRFDGKGAGKLMLDWDDLAHIRDTETRLSQLCRWILRAENEGIHYGLALPGNRIKPGHGELHMHYCLRKLAVYGQDG